jgi:hypothetical protein
MLLLSNHAEAIRRLQDEWGFVPLPCAPGEKHPYVNWTDYRDTPPSPEETTLWFEDPETGAWTITGPISGWAVLDTDNEAGEALWRERLGDLLEQTACVRTRRGYHYFFKVPHDRPFPRWTWEQDPEAIERDAHFDVLGNGYGVMIPPSPFPDGPANDGREIYEWVRGPECALDAPASLRKPSKGLQRPARSAEAASGRSTLAGLLTNRPDEGNRNNWHNKVAGHMAKVIPFEDGFLALASIVNDSLNNPMDEGELLKTWRQAWTTEHDKGKMGNEDTGWLSTDGKRIYTVIRAKDEEDRNTYLPYPWLNGDIRVIGVNEDETGGRAYMVEIVRERGEPVQDVVKPSILATAADRWLGGFGMSVMTPPVGKVDVAGRAGTGNRLIRFFEAQEPPRFRVVQCLGWNHEYQVFLTNTGVILGVPGEAELSKFDGVRPNPEIAENDLVSVRYGFEASEDEAIAVLKEVMRFHYEEFTAVFASFCVASVLKGQMEPLTNVWPYPIVEAPSGSSKSHGFIPMIQQLIGRRGKAGTFTKAAARDALGAHRCLPEWIDDPDDLNNVKELLRLCASEGTSKRKGGIDFRKNIVTELVSTPIITAESVGLLDQKAYMDRAIALTLRNPQTRMSLHDPSKPQIDDIDDLRSKYGGDLSCLAGHVVSLILQRRSLVTAERFRQYRAGHPGRHADKLAILKMGAFVLADILGPDFQWVVDNVEAWIAEQEYDPNANRLTRRLIPDAITLLGVHDVPKHWEGNAPSPVLVRKDKDGNEAIWVNTRHLALWWYAHTKGRIEERTDTEDALTQQADALGMKGRKAGEQGVDFIKVNYQSIEGRRTNAIYRRLPDMVSERLLDGLLAEDTPRSQGASRGASRGGRGGPQPQNGSKPRLDADTVSRIRTQRSTP